MPIIEINNISKKYFINHKGQAKAKYRSIRESITNNFYQLLLRKAAKSEVDNNWKEEYWALSNITFNINQGDKIGIIGRNGAGKSTLLKILSRITEPTSGKVKIKGRVASLLEVGTGFHPELTGRENIFLNGAILGMKKLEIKRKFDEIVAFSEIERFLDTPVKRYSSGMYVRLAFSVAAHLEPEILLIDEVLAVGDYGFQRKCLGKMEDVSKEGRTILFVSHNMQAIENICNKAILLEGGRQELLGDVDKVIYNYMHNYRSKNIKIRRDLGILKFLDIHKPISDRIFKSDDNILLKMAFENISKQDQNIQINFDILNENEDIIIHSKSDFIREPIIAPKSSKFVLSYEIISPKLVSGIYYLTLYIHMNNDPLLWIENIEAFKISTEPFFGKVEYFNEIKSPIIPEFRIILSE